MFAYLGNNENDPWPSISPKATVTPLFEKILSAADADLKLARLIIPQTCAEVSITSKLHFSCSAY